jgi:hypothetical protein
MPNVFGVSVQHVRGGLHILTSQMTAAYNHLHGLHVDLHVELFHKFHMRTRVLVKQSVLSGKKDNPFLNYIQCKYRLCDSYVE